MRSRQGCPHGLTYWDWCPTCSEEAMRNRNEMLVAKSRIEERLHGAGFEPEPNNVWRKGLHWVQLETYGVHYAINRVEDRYNASKTSRRYDTPDEANAIIGNILEAAT